MASTGESSELPVTAMQAVWAGSGKLLISMLVYWAWLNVMYHIQALGLEGSDNGSWPLFLVVIACAIHNGITVVCSIQNRYLVNSRYLDENMGYWQAEIVGCSATMCFYTAYAYGYGVLMIGGVLFIFVGQPLRL